MNDRSQDQLISAVPGALLVGTHKALAAQLGPDEAARVLREIGLETGGALYTLFQEWLSTGEEDGGVEELNGEEFWDRLSDFFETAGWGTVAHERLHPGVIALESATWVEADDGDDSQPGCHLTSGILAEFLHCVAGEPTAVLEVECRSAGDDTCKFLVGNEAALTAVFESLRDGSALAGAIEGLS